MTAESLPLTQDAQSELDRYLRRVRAALRGHSSVDADEVERDVRGHIHAALAESSVPVTEIHLRAVLDRLGSPSQWVPADELSIWRKALVRLQSGPEDWRLTYATFALLIAVPFSGPIGAVLLLGSALLSRATLELLEANDEPVGARRWLLYPPLLVIYAGALAAALLGLPVLIVSPLGDPTIDTSEWIPQPLRAATVLLLAGVAAGIWWVLLGLALTKWHRIVRATFRPFADRFERRHAIRLTYAGFGLMVLAGTALVLSSR